MNFRAGRNSGEAWVLQARDWGGRRKEKGEIASVGGWGVLLFLGHRVSKREPSLPPPPPETKTWRFVFQGRFYLLVGHPFLGWHKKKKTKESWGTFLFPGGRTGRSQRQGEKHQAS